MRKVGGMIDLPFGSSILLGKVLLRGEFGKIP